MRHLLHHLRSFGYKCFRRFGLHCATHQIRVILISCVVITSLFYPALAIYSSSRPLSLSLFDAFAARNVPSSFHAYNDVSNLWSGHDHLKLHEDAVSRVKCSAGRTLRVEQLFIQSPIMDDAGAVNRRLLSFALSLEKRLNRDLAAGEHPCLKRIDGQCFVISPLLFWEHDEDSLLADANVLNTLNNLKNVTLDEISITPQMVLAGRTLREHRVSASTFDFAEFLVMTYFFPESDCLSTSEHASWKQSVQGAISHDAQITFHSQGPTLIALEFDPDRSRGKDRSGLATFVNLAYICFFVYVAWSVRRMDAVHSRLGVTFTALVEIAVSTITSLSVCALVGFKITMVPWELLPVVIVFVGAENMFNLVDAVGKTSVTLPVKQRIAEGLGRAGTSNTLKVLSYIVILGLMASISLGAVRQFCVFAIVVLIAHWFLAHTFFIAVLSIDIQRLELEELLRYDPTVVPCTSQEPDATENLPTTRWRRFVKSIKALLKGRAATNISLLMLLAIAAALYYMTYFSSLTSYDSRLRTASIVVPQAATAISSDALHYSAAGHVWTKINPSQYPLLHLRIEEPVLIIPLPDSGLEERVRDANSLHLHVYIGLSLWLLKIMVLPIAGTTGMLYILLLYLLKDAELLEAQRHREGPENLEPGANALEGQISFSTLPRATVSDVELIASSKDGQTIVSVSLNNELMVHQTNLPSIITVNVDGVSAVPGSTRTIISSVAVQENGEFFAVGTKAGTVLVWIFDKQAVRFFHTLSSGQGPVGIVDLRFLRSSSVVREKPRASEVDLPSLLSQNCGTIVASLENGTVVKWVLKGRPSPSFLTPVHTASISRALLSEVVPDGVLLAAVIFSDGYIELIEAQKNESLFGPDCCWPVGDPSDTITEVHVSRLKLKGTTRTVMAMTTKFRKVLLWDLNSKEQISDIECSETPRRPRVIQGCRNACRTCHLPLENIFLAFALEQNVRFHQLLLHDQGRYCSCLPGHRSRSLLEKPSRLSRGDTTALQSSSDVHSLRPRLAPADEASLFPVSGHGIYPRRTSESTRRSSEILMVPFPGEDYESIHILGTNVLKPRAAASNSLWRNHSLVHFLDISCGKGDWELTSRKIIGLQRKERSKQLKTDAKYSQQTCLNGLPLSTLDRWEIWIFDPVTSHLQTSLLSTIVSKEAADTKSSSIPRMPFTRVSSLVIASNSYALAGFGNTIGLFTFSNV